MNRKKQKKLLSWLGIFIIILLWLILFKGRLSGQRLINYVNGSSMSPNLNSTDIIVTSLDKDYKRYDLVTYNLTDEQNLIAEQLNAETGIHTGRVIGLPKEIIEVRKDTALIDGKEMFSWNTKENQYKTVPSKQIPTNNYFILLDNPGIDSRYFGFISLTQMRKIIKVDAGSPWNSIYEFISGFIIFLFTAFFPWHINKISARNLFLKIISVLHYALLFLFLLLTYVSTFNLRIFSSFLLAYHYNYLGAIIDIFGDNIFSVVLKEFLILTMGSYLVWSVYDTFQKYKKSA